jgi:hypothetical protein
LKAPALSRKDGENQKFLHQYRQHHLLQQDRVDLLIKLIREVLAEKTSAAESGIVP